MLDEVLEVEEGLSGREIDFLDSLDNGWRGRDLTEKQAEWLNKIWERTGGK